MAITTQEKTKRIGILVSGVIAGLILGAIITIMAVIGYINSLSPQQAIMVSSVPTSLIWVLIIGAVVATILLVYEISTLFR
jgi:hypothetical protein